MKTGKVRSSAVKGKSPAATRGRPIRAGKGGHRLADTTSRPQAPNTRGHSPQAGETRVGGS